MRRARSPFQGRPPLHIKLYRARRRYRGLVTAIAEETARRRPDPSRINQLKAQRDVARHEAAAIEAEIDLARADPAWST